MLISAVSGWEVAIKIAVGKLDAPGDLIDALEESGVSWIPVEPRETHAVGRLPWHHRDPFDRLLIAQRPRPCGAGPLARRRIRSLRNTTDLGLIGDQGRPWMATRL
ncbi:MAG: hypothetical protein GEU99_12965 [Luteitalea sp.]|nr:hypothetical protein [Luteitalea sp.]